MLEQYVNVLGQELIDVSVRVVAFLPNFIIGIIILLLGWLFGLILGRATSHIFDVLNINGLFSKLGFSHLSRKSGHDVSLGRFFGGLVK